MIFKDELPSAGGSYASAVAAFFTKLCFLPDESNFHVDGHVVTRNPVIWGDKRPENHFMEKQLNSPHVKVWLTASSEFIIGPYIFDSTVNGEAYLQMLIRFVVPELRRTVGEARFSRISFQQD